MYQGLWGFYMDSPSSPVMCNLKQCFRSDMGHLCSIADLHTAVAIIGLHYVIAIIVSIFALVLGLLWGLLLWHADIISPPFSSYWLLITVMENNNNTQRHCQTSSSYKKNSKRFSPITKTTNLIKKIKQLFITSRFVPTLFLSLKNKIIFRYLIFVILQFTPFLYFIAKLTKSLQHHLLLQNNIPFLYLLNISNFTGTRPPCKCWH